EGDEIADQLGPEEIHRRSRNFCDQNGALLADSDRLEMGRGVFHPEPPCWSDWQPLIRTRTMWSDDRSVWSNSSLLPSRPQSTDPSTSTVAVAPATRPFRSAGSTAIRTGTR